ncbi:sestrin-1 isoform X3 [Mirounga angustirostris]|uniref:sestrin-1 isoform X3 n=1 Tax=Mirounga leonina TaxID=9715 RepID=UPI00156C00E5|nr:sestrin-1 isoform X3 [Mirounga leonina]XP_045721234.1 sestrin-1 isoform X3 [Mirounga angustirostris]
MAEGENEVRWDGLCSRDSTTRETALENIKQTVLRKTEYLRSVKETPLRPSDGLSNAVSLDGLNKLLAHLLMLSKRCPFKDVREKSEFILKSVQELGIRIPRPLGHGPSRFIPEKEILQVGSEDAQMHTLFADSFAALGRLDNITLVMVFHPQYLESFLKTQHYLLQMDGPLPLHYRHYIGIMVSDSFFEVEALMEKMRQLQECRDEEEASQEEMASRFEIEKRESMFVFSSDDEEVTPARDVSRHFEDTSYGYKDFSRHGMHVPTFRVQDYCWEDHGYSLVNRLYPDVGQLIDEKFHIAYNLTYNTMAMHKDVDTSMLRRAIWNYIHCMFGIRYDDYDYGEINQLLDRSFKVYIKTVVCTPEKVTKRMYDSFWRQFKHSEKVHVNLLLIEARMQAELLYALRAITRYMT